MNKDKILNFVKIMDSISHNSEQKAQLKKCKNLNNIGKFIMREYPNSEFSKDELQKCLIIFGTILENNKHRAMQNLSDNQLNLNGGTGSEEHFATKASVYRWNERAKLLQKVAAMADMSTKVFDTLSSDGDISGINMADISNQMISLFSGESLNKRFSSDGMGDTSGRLSRETNIHLSDIKLKSLPTSHNLDSVKRFNTTNLTKQHRFNQYEID